MRRFVDFWRFQVGAPLPGSAYPREYICREAQPDSYTLPVIPRPLPSNVMEGEHFVLADVRRLVSGSASSSRDLVVEASSRVQGAQSVSRSFASSSRGSGSSFTSGRGARGHRPERILPLAQVAGAAPTPSGKGQEEKGARASGCAGV